MNLGGLSWKLFVGNFALVALAFGVSFVVLAADAGRVRNRELRNGLELSARAVADHLSYVLRDYPAGGWPSAAERAALVSDLHLPTGVDVLLTDDNGRPLAGTGQPLDLDALLADGALLRARHEDVAFRRFNGSVFWPGLQLAAARIERPDGDIRGLVILGQPEWTIATDHRFLATTGITFFVATILLTIGLAWGTARLWNRPLRQILDTARSLSRGDTTAAANPDAPDELGLLARAVNRMRDRLVGNVETIDGQRQFLQSLLNQIQEGVVVVNARGQIALINPAAARLLELETAPESLIGIAVERCIPQLDVQRMLLPDNEDSKTQTPASLNGDHAAIGNLGAWQQRLSVEHSDGRMQLLAHASHLVLPQDAARNGHVPVGRLLVLTDITALSRSLQIKTDFVANASHELRTPLSTIRAAVETLQRMNLTEDGEAAERFIGVIERQSTRLEALASDLLELAKLETDTARFQPCPVELREIGEDLRENFARRLACKNITFEVEVDDDEPIAFVNPHLLRLILDNLIDNALKFTDPGGKIITRFKAGPRWFSAEVQDNGCGIPPESQKRVFERFYQVERARAGVERGTGLGLSIVRHATVAMNGRVELESQLNVGTTVRLIVPQPATIPT